MYLSLPLSSSNTRTMTVTVIGTDGTAEPSQHIVSMSKSAELKHFIEGLSASCSLRDDETLLIASVHFLIDCATLIALPVIILCSDYILWGGVKVKTILYLFLFFF